MKEKNILVDIVSKTVGSDVMIQNINTVENPEEYLYEITVMTHNIDELRKFMTELKKINTIFDVERNIK